MLSLPVLDRSSQNSKFAAKIRLHGSKKSRFQPQGYFYDQTQCFFFTVVYKTETDLCKTLKKISCLSSRSAAAPREISFCFSWQRWRRNTGIKYLETTEPLPELILGTASAILLGAVAVSLNGSLLLEPIKKNWIRLAFPKGLIYNFYESWSFQTYLGTKIRRVISLTLRLTCVVSSTAE